MLSLIGAYKSPILEHFLRHSSYTALAQAASQYRLCRPQMTTENVIDIEQGRHLLQELSVAQYVPNDTYLVGGQEQDKPSESDTATGRSTDELPSVLIITGPNNSGKSIYMKQVALIVYLAQVGRRVFRLAMLRFLI